MRKLMTLSLLSALCVIAAACTGGSGDGGGTSSDPRCNALCVIEEPSLEGAFDICSGESQALCIDQCDAQIELAAPLCASCLLEQASYGLEDSVSTGDFCEGGQCTKTGREGSCTYPEGDDAARDECSRQVYPRREVACETEFRPVQECADLCQAG